MNKPKLKKGEEYKDPFYDDELVRVFMRLDEAKEHLLSCGWQPRTIDLLFNVPPLPSEIQCGATMIVLGDK